MNRSPLRNAPSAFPAQAVPEPLSRRRGALRRRPGLEALEGRTLLTASLTDFPASIAGPSALITGPDGNLWVLADGNSNGGSVSVVATDGTLLHTYPIPTNGAGAMALTLGPDGNIWFTEYFTDKIGKVTPTGTITEYPIPNATGGNAPVDMTNPSGPAGVEASPSSIVAGADGALWFTEESSDSIGRITTGGTITQYPTPGLQPSSIARGPDGAIWFTDDSVNNTVDRLNLDPKGNATFSEFTIPQSFGVPTGLTTGPDGALWFAESLSNVVGRITTGGAVTEFPILGNLVSPQGLTFDAAGNLWMDGYGSGLARLTPQGQTLMVSLRPASDISTAGITTGPDGAIWFTDATNNRVGRVDPTSATTLPTDNPIGIDPLLVGQSLYEGSVTFTDTVASFYAGGTSAAASDFTSVVDWGDGTTSAGTVALTSPGQFSVTGTHTYAQHATYAATVTITDVNPATTPRPNVLAVPISVVVGPQLVPIALPVGQGDPIGSIVRSPVFTTLSGGSGVSLSKSPLPAVPGAHSSGGKVTPVIPKKVPVKPVDQGPSAAALFRAGYIKSWYMAAHKTVTPQALVTPPKTHHVPPVRKPFKPASKIVHKAH